MRLRSLGGRVIRRLFGPQFAGRFLEAGDSYALILHQDFDGFFELLIFAFGDALPSFRTLTSGSTCVFSMN